MTKAIIAQAPGLIKVQDIEEQSCDVNSVKIQHQAISINSYDLKQCRGDFNNKYPFVPGCEAVGKIIELGKDVKGLNLGDTVIYSTNEFGAYATSNVLHNDFVVKLPKEINTSMISVIHKAMTAHYLLRRTFFVNDNHTILVQDAAVGSGYFITNLAKHYGCKVIAVVKNEQEKNYIDGMANHIIIDDKNGIVKQVEDYTNGKMVHVVYDSLGEVSLAESLQCLMHLGLFVGYDSTKSAIKTLNIEKLKERGLFATFPNLFLYKSSLQELLLSFNEIFSLIQQKIVKSDIKRNISLEDFTNYYHNWQKNGNEIGQVIIKP